VKKLIAFLMPVYPLHFTFCRNAIGSFKKCGLDEQADFWIVFTNEGDSFEFGEYANQIILPENLRSSKNGGIINIKNFYGVSKLKNKYEYIIVIDAEILFIKNVDLRKLCSKYFNDKMILGNKVFEARKELDSLGKDRYKNIQNSCKRFFKSAKNMALIDTELYLWFNQPCIYKSSNFKDHFAKIPLFSTNSSFSLQWENGWIPPIDGISIYGFLTVYNPRYYVEIGSGNTTMFAAQAIKDFNLKTKITII
jgi:hypothetical protein